MASYTTATTIAEAPFDEDSVDSVVLRTSDLVDFYVVKAVLGLASPFFKDMFSLAQPHTDPSLLAAKEPIVISETSDAIDCLFRLCYPVERRRRRTNLGGSYSSPSPVRLRFLPRSPASTSEFG